MDKIEDKYLPRVIDKIIESRLNTFGAICIEGPKWCGKTWSSLKYSKSTFLLETLKAILEIKN